MEAICPSCKSAYPVWPGAGSSACPRCTDTLARDPRYTPTAVSPGVPVPVSIPHPQAPPSYEVLETLGHGGMGYVIKARDRKLDRLVAIKMPLPALTADPAFRDRFLREARSAARLRHPNLCPIYEVGEHAGIPYIVMALIEGRTLRDHAAAEKLPARRAAEILAVLSRAVAYAHEHGVIHRDLKPANVMIDLESGQPVLMDFGLAKETSDEGSHVTQTGQVVGTPAYMSPEQAAGRAERVGPWSDQYSLGAILYELLTGRPPFLGAVGEVIHQVQHQEPEPPRKLFPALHRDIETVCLKALSKNPQDRYADAGSMAKDLEAFAAGEAIQARRIGPVGSVARLVRRHPAASVSIVAAVALCAALVGFFASRASETRRLSDLARRIDAEEDLDRARALVTELAASDPKAAAAAHAEALRRVLRRPRLEAADREAVERSLATLGKEFREEYGRRLHAWETLMEFRSPPDRFEGKPAKGPAGPVSATTHKPAGNVQLEARFANAGDAAVGLTLGGYAFVVRGAELEVWRGDVVVKGAPLPAPPAGELRVGVQKEGGVFRVQVGDLAATVFEDVFPLPPGTLGVVLPPGAGLVFLRAARQTLAPEASPLEKADELHVQGRTEEALTAYRDEAIRAGTGRFAQEARYKQAVCLEALGRRDEAAELFGEIGAEAGERWPLLALCHVWLLRVEKGALDEAESLLQLVQVRYDPKQLAAGIPEDMRARIVEAYGASSAGAAVLVNDPTRIARLERAIKVVDLLRPQSHQRVWVRWNLMRACHMEGDFAAAERHARDALSLTRRPDGSLGGWGMSIVEDLSWILRLRGAGAEAETLVNGALFDAKGAVWEGFQPLLLDLARIRAAAGKWEEAEREVARFFEAVPATEMDFRAWGSGWLLRGFLAERRGDAKGAEEAWKEGTREHWAALARPTKPATSGMDHHLGLVLASLSGTMTQEHVDLMVGFLVKENSPGAARPQELLRGILKLTPEHLAGLFRGPRGFSYARDLAYMRIPLADLVEGPACLLALELLTRSMKRPLAAEEDELGWGAARGWVKGYRTGRIAMGQLLQLGMSYRGVVDGLGWAGLAPKLPPELRGPIAYFLGFRLEEMARPDVAAALWKTAQRDAPEGSALRRLAQQELGRLGQ